MDLIDSPKDRFDEIVAEVLRVAQKKFGAIASFAFVPVSAWTGMNLIAHDDERCAWWPGTEVQNPRKESKLCRSLFEAMVRRLKVDCLEI